MMQTKTQADQAKDKSQLIRHAREYVSALESADTVRAQKILNDIRSTTDAVGAGADSVLFEKVGHLTRELHDSINRFTEDSTMLNLMKVDMPDARQRLNHVIELTEKSAHDIMASIENSLPMIEAIKQRSDALAHRLLQHSEWATGNVSANKKDKENVSEVIDEMKEFLEQVKTGSDSIGHALNDIMMAQSYQDLTGQIIQRVITLVQNVEKNLIGLLHLGVDAGVVSIEEVMPDRTEKNRVGHGPAVTTGDQKGRCETQDDVDDLLSTLGF